MAIVSSFPAPHVADLIAARKARLLAEFRAQVRPLSGRLARLEDEQLEDHLPRLIDALMAILRQGPGHGEQLVQENGAHHGLIRRQQGGSVADIAREINLFRRMLLALTEQAATYGADAGEIEAARTALLELVDRSQEASIASYNQAGEDARRAAQAEARELHMQRDRFLTTLSHELRNQISPILLSVRVLKSSPLSERQQRSLSIVERQARHQSVLIENLLEISRFRYGKVKLKRASVDLRLAVEQAVESCQSDIEAKALNLTVELPERPVIIDGDVARLVQVMVNLLSNAVKFTPAEGHIAVRLHKEAGELLLSVSDSGVGIPAMLMPRIFDMFYEVENHGTLSGLGIGLWLARRLVEMHGGSISAASEGAGKGASFCVRLPALQPVQLANRLLLVEDSLDQLEALSEVLTSEGFAVLKASEAGEALRLASCEHPFAAIVDIGLPGMNGLELARELRAIPGLGHLRLIALSGYGTEADRKAAHEAGFDHHLVKPPDIDRLKQLLLADSKDRVRQRHESLSGKPASDKLRDKLQ
ncbi:MAG TPA: hybrid sensor histidine kinase/response regulator [Candidatus Binataceae bacterium]|nr:hybrid sensor histidine kinase/response regulator [Candidatus Binataceae bacterium]